MTLHLIKLCVGVDHVEELEAYWKGSSSRVVHTRQTPKQADALLDGGSLYWVIKGKIQCRQPVLAVDTLGEGQDVRCEITLGLPVVRTSTVATSSYSGRRSS